MAPALKNFTLIQDGVDVSGVLSELEANPDLWGEHGRRKTAPGSPHTGMSDIWVRYNDDAPYERGERPWTEFNDLHLPVWYRGWDLLPSLKPIVFDLMAQVEGEMIGGVLITRIPPGQGIDWHADQAGWHVQYFEKFYLSLKSAPGAKFWCDADGEKEALEPKPGEIWLFDNRKPHAVTNHSGEDRITCIICLRTEKFGRGRNEGVGPCLG